MRTPLAVALPPTSPGVAPETVDAGGTKDANGLGILNVNATFAPSGTQDVNISKVLGSTISAANPVPSSDAGIAQTTVRGLVGVPFTSADQSGAAAQCSDAPASGQKLVLTDLIVSVDTAMTLTFTCQTSGAVIHKIFLAANSTINLVCRGKVKLATANKYLMVQTSVAGNITVEPIYYSEA